MSTRGIDVSKWNGAIDFNKVKAAGYDFVIINAGYGRYISQKDPYFEINYKNAKAAGLGVGAYWYSYAVTATDAETEAKAFAQAIAGKQFEYPIAFDLEDPSQNYLSKKILNDMCDAFIGYLEKQGYYVCLYSFTSFLSAHIYQSTLSKYDLWLAEWSFASKPTYSGDYGMWQYSEKGAVPGIPGNVDLNIAYKDYPTIMKQGGFNGFEKIKMEEPEKPKAQFVSGDANGDGKVDVTDVSMIAAHVKGQKAMTNEQAKRADVNDDGKVNTTDISTVAAKVKGATKTETEWTTYTVHANDTLFGIAKKFGVSVVQIAADNNIKNVNIIYTGQKLQIRKK